MRQRGEPAPLVSARFLTPASLRWVIRHRAYTPWYLVRYWRFARFRLRNRHVVVRGFVFMDRGVELYARRGYGRLILGRWVHLGADTALRCHEGTLSLGDKSVLARGVSVNCYLDVEIGASALIADNVYVSDFDHRFDDVTIPIKDQGIRKARVRIGGDVWLGTKSTVTCGVTIGAGTVVGANSVVTGDLPAHSVAVGAPARVIKDRRSGRAAPDQLDDPAEPAARQPGGHDG
jgi:acetyltransferase-like isoleucine patch superfamily enzyme